MSFIVTKCHFPDSYVIIEMGEVYINVFNCLLFTIHNEFVDTHFDVTLFNGHFPCKHVMMKY